MGVSDGRVEALRWYADQRNWTDAGVAGRLDDEPDFGERARAALEAAGEKEDLPSAQELFDEVMARPVPPYTTDGKCGQHVIEGETVFCQEPEGHDGPHRDAEYRPWSEPDRENT